MSTMPTMPTMAAVMEEVEQRTRQQHNVGQDAERVGPVFGQQEEGGDRQHEAENDLSAARSGRIQMHVVVFMIHVGLLCGRGVSASDRFHLRQPLARTLDCDQAQGPCARS
jgi:hypothetical protein